MTPFPFETLIRVGLTKERIEEIQIPINIFYSDLTPIEQEILLLKKKLNEIIRILNG